MTQRNAAAGARDRQITIQQLTESVGASRMPVESWSPLAVVWANKEDVSGTERFIANQVSAPFQTRWTIPYMTSMDPDLVDVAKQRRLVVQGRVHDIVSAQEIGRKSAIELRTVSGGLL